MEVDASGTLILPLSDATSAASAWTSYAVLLLLGIVAAVYHYAHVSFNAHTAFWRAEWAHREERAGRRAGPSADRTAAMGISLGLASGLFRISTVVWAGWLIVAAAFSAGGPVWLLVIGLALLLTLLFSLADLLIKRSAAPGSTDRPARLVRFLSEATFSLLLPIAGPLSRLAVVRTAAAQGRVGDEQPSEEDIETGVLEEDEEQLGDYIAEFRETEVREIMTSRMDIVAMAHSASLADVVDTIRRSGHSRLPIYRDHLDHIEGILYVKDLLPLLAREADDEVIHWASLAREPLLVSADQAIEDLLRAFKVKRMHLAIVVDEYGGTEGLVTLEDIIEELVGDIRDEFDHDEPDLYERLEERLFRFDARIDLDEFVSVLEEALGRDLYLDTDEFDFETLGGLIQHLTESVPVSGIEVDWHDLHLTVETVEQHRIGHVLVRVREQEADREGTGDD